MYSSPSPDSKKRGDISRVSGFEVLEQDMQGRKRFLMGESVASHRSSMGRELADHDNMKIRQSLHSSCLMSPSTMVDIREEEDEPTQQPSSA
ncbi:hypothetical protein GOP47_0011111, partial [Adiantum capillus-veneris]